jgi:uncharacterized protein YhaN
MMLAWLIDRTGLGRVTIIAIAIAGLAALGGLGVWRATAAVERMVERAATSARVERDAAWRAEIEKANAAVARAEAAQVRVALAADAEIKAAQTRLEGELKDLETKNAALAQSGDCGVGRDRVRLLNNHAR